MIQNYWRTSRWESILALSNVCLCLLECWQQMFFVFLARFVLLYWPHWRLKFLFAHVVWFHKMPQSTPHQETTSADTISLWCVSHTVQEVSWRIRNVGELVNILHLDEMIGQTVDLRAQQQTEHTVSSALISLFSSSWSSFCCLLCLPLTNTHVMCSLPCRRLPLAPNPSFASNLPSVSKLEFFAQGYPHRYL